jgi:hypothetical protein
MAALPEVDITVNAEPGYDFGGAEFDLHDPGDREIIRFVLSQALFGEATGVYCGKSLYSARSLEAAKFYLRQARQELNHLELFADVFRTLGMTPLPAHWTIVLLSSHNNYYPLKVVLEHAVGEGMVLDIFKEVLLQTLPDSDERIPDVKKKLRVVCKEEIEHVAWGEKETRRILAESPWLKTPFYGLVEIQLLIAPIAARRFVGRSGDHKVLKHLEPFMEHVKKRVWAQGQTLGFIPAERPGLPFRLWAMFLGVLLFVRSQFARSYSTLDHTYLAELGFKA